VEIACHANYDRDHGALTLSMLTTPSTQQNCGICMTNNFYDVPSMTKIMVLPTTSTSFRRPMPRRLAQERSTIF
jgi:hypothetical protein